MSKRIRIKSHHIAIIQKCKITESAKSARQKNYIENKETTYMKKESLHIENFGPIKNVYIEEIKPFMVFIGESGSGKSTIIKLIALFRWIYKMMCIRTFLKSSGIKDTFKFDFGSYLTNNEQDHFVKKETVLTYTNGSITITYKGGKLSGSNASVPADEISLEKISFIADKRVVIPDMLSNNFSILKGSFYLSESYRDYLLATDKFKSLDLPFLKVRWEVQKTSNGQNHYLVSLDEKNPYRIELTEASSGMQATTSLAVIVEYFAKYYDLIESINKSILSYASKSDNWLSFKPVANLGDFKYRHVSLFIEEPELSLFPNAQNGLMHFISERCFNGQQDYNLHVLMTSHSPYILNYLNVLINEREDSNSAIPAQKVGAYRVIDGRIEPLLGIGERGNAIIDTRSLSDEIKASFNQYKALTSK